MTIPERRLWNLLRNHQLFGLKFRRQHPIGSFIVDFYCESIQLVVEIDGRSHDGRGDYDKQRQNYLEAAGIKVFRAENDDVIWNTEAVLMGIARAAGIDVAEFYGNLQVVTDDQGTESIKPLTPGPSPEGEGSE